MTTSTVNIDKYRNLVQTYINLHVYNAALFWADKVVALTGSPRDVYWLAQCMYLLGEYHRASHLLRSKNLDKMYVLCNYLTVKCLLQANELNEALKVINLVDAGLYVQNTSTASYTGDLLFFDDAPRNQILASVLLLKGKVLENMDNRGLASDCYKHALQYDVYCYEAFESLVKHQMLSAAEEEDLINSIPISEQCNQEESEILLTLYESKLKKYHTPTAPKPNENRILLNNTSNLIGNLNKHLNLSYTTPYSIPSLPTTPNLLITPASISTPNITKNNEKNLRKSTGENDEMETGENPLILKLKDSLDLHVAQATRLYYNCDYQQCIALTEAILKQDPYHSECLPYHISCQVELKQSSQLFVLAHNLIDLYPNLAISWYAVGCYYYIIGKRDCSRRYLVKATCLDRLFGPAWLAYGHSFAIEKEHDQAMAAYFKASQLMKGCHLPLLYIGLECGLTNNVRLAEKFFKQAQLIAPDDPFVLHEMGVIAFQNLNYKTAEKYFLEALARIKKIKSNLIPYPWEALLNNLGHTCRKLQKYKEALDYHNQALLLSPQSASTYASIAFVHALMHNTDEAVDWFHKALSLKNDDSFCTTMLTYVIEQLSEEKPAYPGAPEEIPVFEPKPLLNDSHTLEESSSAAPNITNEMTDMSMSIEVDMSDASGIVKE